MNSFLQEWPRGEFICRFILSKKYQHKLEVFEVEIKGKRITIRRLKLEDVFYMRRWGRHRNPLLEDYNFPTMSDRGVRNWYKLKVSSLFNKYYGVLNENGQLVGYMGIKEIKYIRRISTLGLVVDADHMNEGYGTEILDTFLQHYFSQMKMKKCS